MTPSRRIRSTRQPEFHHQRQTNDLSYAGSHATRTAIGIFGMVGGAVMVAMVAYYGYATSDTPAGGTIAAFWFAIIATGASAARPSPCTYSEPGTVGPSCGA